MQYFHKVIDGAGRERVFPPCSSYTVTTTAEGSHIVREQGVDPGILIELDGGQEIHLPRDGVHCYVMNNNGDTIDSHHWPLRQRRETA